MNWKKRKKRRKIANHYNWDHWALLNKRMKFLIKTSESRYITDHPDEFHWRDVLEAINKICDAAGTPEKKLTEAEWWDKVKECAAEMIAAQEAYEDEVIAQFLDDEFRKRQISVLYNIDMKGKKDEQ